MEVQIAFECICDRVSKYWSKSPTHQPLINSIKQNAIIAWNNRQIGQDTARFMQCMSHSEACASYRFLNVTQRGNKLIVSRR